jgi:dCTP diphosphatase
MTSTAFTLPITTASCSPKSVLTMRSASLVGRVDFAYLRDNCSSGGATNDTINNHTTEPINKKSLATTRDQIFQLGAMTGKICTTFLSVPHDYNRNADDDDESRPSPNDDPFWTEPSPQKDELSKQLGELFLHLFTISATTNLDLLVSILKKIELNGQKYPVELCKGKAGKYTDYSELTGITKNEGQCTIHTPTKTSTNDMEDTTTVEGVTILIRNFADERLWHRHHCPRNIALAIMGEVGELAEIFQWKKDEGALETNMSEKELDKVGQEIADVAIYLLRLADVCHVPLGEEARKLIEAR